MSIHTISVQQTLTDNSRFLYHIKNADQSLLIVCSRVPSILYWGSRLEQLDFSFYELTDTPPQSASFEEKRKYQLVQNLLALLSKPVPQGGLDTHIPLTLVPESGAGFYGAAGLEGHREGKDWAPVFNATSSQFSSDLNYETLVFILEDPQSLLRIKIKLNFHLNSGILDKKITLTNLSQECYSLNKLAHTLPFFDEATQLISFHGRWCQEMQKIVQPISRKSYLQENRRGKTSLEYFPGMIIGDEQASEDQGKVIGFHLGWSGNHQIRVDVETDGQRFIQANELLLPGEIILKSGESYSTPHLYASFSHEGFNGMSQQFHQFVRQELLNFSNNSSFRPIHLNTWEGIYFDHDPNYLLKMADKAAEIGIERFIVDDGWFKGRSDDKRALGDWFVDENKYPEGLNPIIKHVINSGMQFGLWVEPEMISKNSDLYRLHPDWLLAIDGYDQPTGRWQYVLDLQNPNCFNYLLERLDALLTQYDISYLKWDMNRDLVQPGHKNLPAVHAQTQSVYRLIDTLKLRHPDVEIESCASGGGRMDFEILKRTQRFWASDCNDALERQTIQRHLSYFFPSEVLGTHIGAATSHSTYRKHTMNFRGNTALFGHMGIEFDPLKASTEEIEELKKYLEIHKRFRSLLHHSKIVRIESNDKAQLVHGVYNDNEALVSISQLNMPNFSIPPKLKLPFLDPKAIYEIECVDIPIHCGHLMKSWPQWLDESIVQLNNATNNTAEEVGHFSKRLICGEFIAQLGLALPILDPESTMLVYFKKQLIDLISHNGS